MGTSKGYIAPTKPEWTNTKRAITSMLKNPTQGNLTKVVDRYALALLTDNLSTSSFPSAISGFIGLINSVKTSGINAALREHGLEDLIGKSSYEVLNTLLIHYSNGNGTIDDNLIIDCLSKLMKTFEVDKLEDFNDIQTEQILKELVISFIQLKFEQLYEEKIMANRPPEEGSKRMREVDDYLRSHLNDTLVIEDISNIDFKDLQGQTYIIKVCQDTYNLLRTYD